MQAMPVQTVTVTLAPVAQSSEYVATIKSRRSATLLPQVSGMLTKILVHSGDHVKAGQVLMEIDPRLQMATVDSARATERQKKALYDYNTVEVERQRKLFEAGVTSRDAYDQAQQSFGNTKADYESAVELRKTQEEQLAYYTIRAPFDGVVGDIPVHVGDFVSPMNSPATVLTTVDENKDLEAYIYIPTERAEQVRLGLDVELMDNTGKLLEKTKIDFLSPASGQHAAGDSGEGAGARLAGDAAQRADDQGAGDLEHDADGGGSGAGGDAAGRAELRLRGAGAERPLYGSPDVGHAGRYGGQRLLRHFGAEGGRPGDRVEHAVPGERHAGDADGRLRRSV